jgi:hypothetical protein
MALSRRKFKKLCRLTEARRHDKFHMTDEAIRLLHARFTRMYSTQEALARALIAYVLESRRKGITGKDVVEEFGVRFRADVTRDGGTNATTISTTPTVPEAIAPAPAEVIDLTGSDSEAGESSTLTSGTAGSHSGPIYDYQCVRGRRYINPFANNRTNFVRSRVLSKPARKRPLELTQFARSANVPQFVNPLL